MPLRAHTRARARACAMPIATALCTPALHGSIADTERIQEGTQIGYGAEQIRSGYGADTERIQSGCGADTERMRSGHRADIERM